MDSKAHSPMLVTCWRFVIDANEDVSAKQCPGTVLAPEGHSNEVRPVLRKADPPMLVTCWRLLIDESEDA